MDKAEWDSLLPKASRSLYQKTLEMGGKITAEHGIGLSRKKVSPHGLYRETGRPFKGIKRTFDPNGIRIRARSSTCKQRFSASPERIRE